MYLAFVRLFHKYLSILFKSSFIICVYTAFPFTVGKEKHIFLILLGKVSLPWVISTRKHVYGRNVGGGPIFLTFLSWKISNIHKSGKSSNIKFFFNFQSFVDFSLRTQTKLHGHETTRKSNLSNIP